MIVAGGGTGGHFFPGLAAAQAVLKEAPASKVLFVGGHRGIEASLAPRYGFSFKGLAVYGFAGVNILRRIRALLALPFALVSSVWTLLRFRPEVVLGVGGYASLPTSLAAGLAGVPLVLLEQNVSPGMANRLLGRLAGRVVTAFPQTLASFRGKGLFLGNPVRAQLAAVGAERPPARPFRLLVFGGSRGARAINAAMVQLLPELKAFPGGIEIVHQTGAEDLEEVRGAYERSGLPVRVEPFLFEMEKEYAWCHAVACRAGATTLAELAMVGRPALLIPFPQAAGDHQAMNAQGLERMGAALCVLQQDLDSASLMTSLITLADPDVRRRMVRALVTLAKPNAARDIAELLLRRGREP